MKKEFRRKQNQAAQWTVMILLAAYLLVILSRWFYPAIFTAGMALGLLIAGLLAAVYSLVITD